MNSLLYISAAVIFTAVTLGFCRCRHPLLAAARSAVSGLSAMLLVNLTSAYTGCYIAVNTATVFVSTVLSLPGVLCLLIMKIIYNY
ncbi:MAG: pro-sigmaK processing inhibitor BofA family protein [Oscillospiraceae bacterium]|nr:pro-sigmaK processing inhibitor BofA family protein [Oscillospiraceae bacterium]